MYRKYRPQTFSDVISQPHIIKTLTNQLKSEQTSHAYLFTGSRGTGKTTCAKILAKALNCTDLKNGDPCLICDNCRLIEEGTPDIVEIDAASNNGVDDVRALREEIVYLPVSCKYRVYIIDEVHMLSGSAFNALLKTLEEPPEHVVFILATTENHKVPATVLSRCQRFEFHRIKVSDSADKLLQIAENEKLALDRAAAELISRLSDGGMRDALSLLDTCFSAGNNVTAELVRDCAGVAGNKHLFALSAAIKSSDAGKTLKIIDELHNSSKDMARLIDELIIHYRNFMLLKTAGSIFVTAEEEQEYLDFADSLSLSEIMRILDILIDSYEKILRSKERKTLAEICMVRLCSKILDIDAVSLSARIEALELSAHNSAPVKKIPNPIPLPSEIIAVSDAENQIEAETEIRPEFRQWGDVLGVLPKHISGMLDGCNVLLEKENVVIFGGKITESIIKNPNNYIEILSAVKRITGKDYNVVHKLKDGEEILSDNNKISKLDEFLNRASEHGVHVKFK